MKRRFSMGQALGAPFGLLKRRPGSLFLWGLLHVAFSGLVLAALWPMVGDMMGEFSALAQMGDMGDGDVPPAFMSEMTRFQAIVQAMNLLQLLFGVVLFNAAMRATLATRGDGFAFLRIGMDELRVIAGALAIFIGVYLCAIVLTLVGVGVFFAAFSQGEQVGIPVMIVYVGFSMLAVIWLLARAMLILPVSMIEKTFAFAGGWQLGKGQAAKLAVTGFLSWLLLMIVEMLFLAALILAALAIGWATDFDWSVLNGLGDPPQTPAEVQAVAAPFWPLLVFIIPWIFLVGFAQAMVAAPLASAARQLLDSVRPKPRPADYDPDDDGLSPIVPAAAVAVASDSDRDQGAEPVPAQKTAPLSETGPDAPDAGHDAPGVLPAVEAVDGHELAPDTSADAHGHDENEPAAAADHPADDDSHPPPSVGGDHASPAHQHEVPGHAETDHAADHHGSQPKPGDGH